MDIIIQHLCTNGYIEISKFFEAPFSKVSFKGMFGVFTPDQANEVVSLLEQVNQYAEVG